MLQKLSRQAKACHKRAAEAKQKAEAAKDLVSKAILLEIEKQWLALARNYMSKESVGDLPASMPDRQPRPDERVRVNRSLRLQEIRTSLIQEGNLHGLYDRSLGPGISLMSAETGCMQKYNPELGELLLLAAKGDFHPEAAAFWERVNRASATTCGMALSLGSRVIVPDIESCDFMAGTDHLEALRQSNVSAS